MRGGFLGDFVKGKLNGQYPLSWEQGIRLHRFIDSSTDKHQKQDAIRKKLPPHFYRYSGIVTDMMCDYFLAQHWQDFHPRSLEDFNKDCMYILNNESDKYGDAANQVLARMHQGSWLVNYRDLNYVCQCLERIGTRIRFDNPLHECEHLLPKIYGQIESDCIELLKDTSHAVTQWRKEYLPDLNL